MGRSEILMGLGLSVVLGLAACNDEKPADGNACPAVASTLSSLRVTVEGSKILDAAGREVADTEHGGAGGQHLRAGL